MAPDKGTCRFINSASTMPVGRKMMVKLFLCLAFATVSVCAECPEGWSDYSGSGDGCYRLFPDRVLGFYDAQRFCWSQGAILPEIRSEFQNQIVDLLRGSEPVWLGARNDYDVRWYWEEQEGRSSFTYLNWRESEGEPSDLNHHGACMFMGTDGQWFDTTEEGTLKYQVLCRKEPY